MPTSLAGPVYLAKLAVTFQRFSGDRLGWWIATGPDGAGAGRAFGDPLTGADAHARDAELLTIARRVHAGEAVDHAGPHFSVVGGGFAPPLAGRPFPPVAVAGPATVAADLAAAHGDHLVLTSTDADRRSAARWPTCVRRAEDAGRTRRPAGRAGRRRPRRRGRGPGGRRPPDRQAPPPVTATAPVRPAPRRAARRQLRGGRRPPRRLARRGRRRASSCGLAPAVDEAYRLGHHLRPLLEARTAEEADRVA